MREKAGHLYDELRGNLQLKPLSQLLPKAAELANLIQAPDLERWAVSEMKGYAEEEAKSTDFPEYRTTTALVERSASRIEAEFGNWDSTRRERIKLRHDMATLEKYAGIDSAGHLVILAEEASSGEYIRVTLDRGASKRVLEDARSSFAVQLHGFASRVYPPQEVFVVHGRDEDVLVRVENFLHRLELKPIVLSHEPNRGKTIIEKFEEHAERARFAVVLITPDDQGALSGESTPLSPRARQNVMFELGYFFAKLGRRHVCVLHKGEVELPSDINGILHHRLDGNWEMALAREMREAGISADLNKL